MFAIIDCNKLISMLVKYMIADYTIYTLLTVMKYDYQNLRHPN